MATPKKLLTGLFGAIGGRLHVTPGNPPIFIFVEFAGTVASVDPSTGVRKPLGAGYAQLEDIEIAPSGKEAYISERGGTIYRVDLTQPDIGKATATVLASGL